MNHRVFSAFILIGSALALTGCGNSSGSDVVKINDETVSRDEFNKAMELKSTARVRTASGQVVEGQIVNGYGMQTLTDLVQRKLLVQLAKDEGVYPSDKEIADEIEFKKKQDPNFLKEASAAGITLDQIKQDVMIDLSRRKIITKNVKVGPQDVDQYIKDNPIEFKTRPLADMYWIVVPNEDQKKLADQDLASGLSFQAVAARYSMVKTARQDHGVFPQRDVSAMPKELSTLVNKTDELKATEWLRIKEGWAKWFISKKTPAKDVKIDDTVRELVKRRIELMRGSRATDLDKKLMDKLKAAKIDVMDKSYKSTFDKQLEQLKMNSAPAPAAPASGATSAKTTG